MLTAALVLAVTLLQTAPAPNVAAPPTTTVAEALERIDERDRRGVAAALERAGGNAPELVRALVSIEPEMRPGMAFLVATMPERDLTSLSADFLLSNVRLAYAAWRGAPWGAQIPEQMFLQYILPYANLNERRDDWRADFVRRFQAEAWKLGSRSAALRWLNDHLNDAVGVHYHASKRKKADQSPGESMELGWASCTGLSILLADACRAVGIPARCVGCPAWKVVQGNHTWVEAFLDCPAVVGGGSGAGAAGSADEGLGGERWFNVGDTGSDPRGENWVNERCRTETDPDDWAHAVYAAAWRPTGRHFPLPWEWEIDYVPALNVTRFYSAAKDRRVTAPRPGPATVEALWNGELVVRKRLDAGATDAVLRIAEGEPFTVVIRYDDGTRGEVVLPAASAPTKP
jgi:transglutaminase-like putative cysteine protease